MSKIIKKMNNLLIDLKLFKIKSKLNKDILFRFLMDTASETQSSASNREPEMKIISFAFYSEDFDKYLINKKIDLGKDQKKRLRIINMFIEKHSKSNSIWMRKEDSDNLNNFYFFRM